MNEVVIKENCNYYKLSNDEKKGKLILDVEIRTLENGKKELRITAYAYDNLTDKVFIKHYATEEESLSYRVRKVENEHYENSIDFEKEDLSDTYVEVFDTFEEAEQKAKEIIEEVVKLRKIVRNAKKEKYYVALF